MKCALYLLPILFLFLQFSGANAQEKVTPTTVEGFDTPISLGLLNASAIYLPDPIYPRAASQPTSSGDVSVQITINVQEGKVVLAKALSGNPVFRRYAEEAALKAKLRSKPIEGGPLFAKGVLIFAHPSKRKIAGKTDEPKDLPIIVVAGLVNKRAIFLPRPVPPVDCRCSGTIKVRIVTNETGRVIDASAVAGHPLLRVAAIKAARQVKFTPINVEPINIVAFLEYNF